MIQSAMSLITWKKIQDLIYVTAFSNNNKLTVFLNKNLGQLNFLEKNVLSNFHLKEKQYVTLYFLEIENRLLL